MCCIVYGLMQGISINKDQGGWRACTRPVEEIAVAAIPAGRLTTQRVIRPSMPMGVKVWDWRRKPTQWKATWSSRTRVAAQDVRWKIISN